MKVKFYLLFAIPFLLFASCSELKKNKDVFLKINKASILTLEKSPEIRQQNGDIDYQMIKKYYPGTRMVLALGFRGNNFNRVPVGLAIDDGEVINEVVHDYGLIAINPYGIITVDHGNSFNSDFMPSLKKGWDLIQVQSLLRGDMIANIKNDVKEDHFILLEDSNGDYYIESYTGKLSDLVKSLQYKDVVNVLKLGGGSANGGAILHEDGTIEKLSQLRDSQMVAVILLE